MEDRLTHRAPSTAPDATPVSDPAPPPGPERALVFVGFMGAGKSTAARRVAATRKGGREPQDSDDILERRLGHSIAREFADHGEARFREREEQVVLELLDRAGSADVIALGGGSLQSEPVRNALKAHCVVYLEVDADTAWRRATDAQDTTDRPLARDRDRFDALHAARRSVYEDVADAILPPHDQSPPAGAVSVLEALAAGPGDLSLLWATTASGDYPVLIGPGALAGAPWPLSPSSRRFCVTDEHVETHHLGRLSDLAGAVVIAPGETHKTLHTAERVWRALAAQGVSRSDHLVALGGGVVGDLAGFCAATYQRGIPVVQVPTTLVGQVDSAYGGKTGVDLPEAKNYVGAYHQPAGVIVDTATLHTLPAAELAAGWAEVIKTALIAGGGLWARVESGAGLDERMIRDCARTKLAVVGADERDVGARQVLNLGHTVGHAIETATAYARYRHGEAVGLGLLAALRLSGAEDLRDRVAAMLAKHGLPTRLEGTDAQTVLAATARDKKRTPDGVPYVLLEAPGKPRPGCAVAQADVLAAVVELTTANQ